MAKLLHPVLARLKNSRVVFHGKFRRGEVASLTALTQAHGGAVVTNLDAKVTYLVLPDLASGAAAQKKATALRQRGTAIEVKDAAAFREVVSPTQDELLALLKGGQRGTKALASVAPIINVSNHHGAAPGCLRLMGACLDGFDLSGLDLSGLAFDNCRFVGAKLDSTQIIEAIACDFSKATGASPRFGKIDGSCFAHAQFSNAEFHSHLQGSRFTGAKLENSLFSGNFWASRVTPPPSKVGPCFERASLRNCIFDHVWIDDADFSDADLVGAAFNNCHLEGASFRNATARDTLFVAADMAKADLANASLVGSNLAEADLAGARLDGADMTDVNLRGAKIPAGSLNGLKGANANSATIKAVGPALIELDSIFQKARHVKISFRVGKGPEDEGHEIEIITYSKFASWGLPDLNHKISPRPLGPAPFSEEILQAGRVLGHLQVRFETLAIKSTKSPKFGKALRDLVVRGIAEAFGQQAPCENDPAGAAAHREQRRLAAAALRERRELARVTAAKEKEKAKKQLTRRIEKVVGKVSDATTFLKALELRIDKPKIDKATQMLKASRFKLFNDVTGQDVSGVVKSQTDPDLVYACRVAEDGQYACCTQNLHVCGGLRGSICKHLLVLIIGLVQAGELDPITIDEWVARTHGVKPVLDKENMGAIFFKYKGAEAGELDWRPTETIPEDFYAM